MVDPIKPDGPAPRARPPYTRRQIISQVAIAAVILISGMGIGTGGTILTLKDRIVWHPRPPRSNDGRPPGRLDIIGRWRTEYALTDDQARQAQEAFDKSMATTHTFFVDLDRKHKEEQANFAASMKSILTPEQYQKWYHDFSEFQKRADRWRRGGPGGRPDGPPGGDKDGHKRRGPFRDNRGFQPPPGREPPPGEAGLPPSPNLPGGPEPAPQPE
jgi:hypothetical protein